MYEYIIVQMQKKRTQIFHIFKSIYCILYAIKFVFVHSDTYTYVYLATTCIHFEIISICETNFNQFYICMCVCTYICMFVCVSRVHMWWSNKYFPWIFQINSYWLNIFWFLCYLFQNVWVSSWILVYVMNWNVFMIVFIIIHIKWQYHYMSVFIGNFNFYSDNYFILC